MKATLGMTVSELINLSGITKQTSYVAHDTAVPMYQDERYGTYPYGGHAISVYWKGRMFEEIIPYYELARMALDLHGPSNLDPDQAKDLELYAMQEDEVRL